MSKRKQALQALQAIIVVILILRLDYYLVSTFYNFFILTLPITSWGAITFLECSFTSLFCENKFLKKHSLFLKKIYYAEHSNEVNYLCKNKLYLLLYLCDRDNGYINITSMVISAISLITSWLGSLLGLFGTTSKDGITINNTSITWTTVLIIICVMIFSTFHYLFIESRKVAKLAYIVEAKIKSVDLLYDGL